jgi:hypothetical protein
VEEPEDEDEAEPDIDETPVYQSCDQIGGG